MLIIGACLALVIPYSFAFTMPPTNGMLNQLAAVAGWGAFIFILGTQLLNVTKVEGYKNVGILTSGKDGVWTLLLFFCCIALITGISAFNGKSIATRDFFVVIGAIFCLWTGYQVGQAPFRDRVMQSVCIALSIMGIVNVIITIVQMFFPQLANDILIASASGMNRAIGNYRQPNHLSTSLLISAAALIWCGVRYDWMAKKITAYALLLMLWLITWGILVTGSRTGMLGVILLGVWGVLDRRMNKSMRFVMVSLVVAYAVMWLGMSFWSKILNKEFIGDARLKESQSDLSNSRFAIWSNAIDLIKQQPWTGVGWDNFNFAWTLTIFPNRPTQFFDNAHNFVIQLIVELGIVLGGLLIILAFWSYLRLCIRTIFARADVTRSTCLFMITVVLVHGLLEYPLWYIHFLYITVFLMAFSLVDQDSGLVDHLLTAPKVSRNHLLSAVLCLFMGLIVIGGAMFANNDYKKIVQMYLPSPEQENSLDERINDGKTSKLFAYHAAYASVNNADHSSVDSIYSDYPEATSYLLDFRLMRVWIEAEKEKGNIARAIYLSHRLKEFNHPAVKGFFALCDKLEKSDPPPQELPVQCRPDVPLKWTDFVWH